jgi:hypothetical protein
MPAVGVIGLVEVAPTVFPASTFDALDWDAPVRPAGGRAGPEADAPYERFAFSQEQVKDALARFSDAGAMGVVVIVGLPAAHIPGAYLLYDGIHRGMPAVFCSRETAAGLRAAAERGASAQLVLEAEIKDVETHNVIGVIPGASDELIVLQSHHDGPNAVEDNGPEAIVAMAPYLSQLPAADLPRSVLVLLSTGHFVHELASGVRNFLEQHAQDLVPRIAAVLTLEHLGALPSRIDRERGTSQLEYEFGCFFATPHRALIDVVRAALIEADVTEARVLRPFLPDTSGLSPDGLTWPADGCGFWTQAGLPAANFITGPDYLFNVEPVGEFIDVTALRRQAIAFTEAALQLAATPWEELHRRLDPSCGAVSV